MENCSSVSCRLIGFERIVVFGFLFSLMIPLSTPIGPAWSRIYFWDFSLVTMYIFWIVRVGFNDERTIKFSFLDAILITLILWFFVCDIVGVRPVKSLEPCFLWVRGFLVYLYFSKNIGRVISVRSFLRTILVLVVFEGALSIFQEITKSNFGQINQYFGTTITGFSFKDAEFIRAGGTFINPNILAAWMIVLMPIILGWYFYENNRVLKTIIAGSMVVGLLSTISTLSRSKLVTIIFGLFIIFFWHRDKVPLNISIKNLRSFFFKTVTLFFLIIVVLGLSGYSDVFKGSLKRFGRMDINFERKFTQMIIAVEIMKESPVFGVGQGNYGYNVDKERYPYRHRGEVTCHNIPLKIGAESGVIGFITFISFCLYVFVKWFRVIKTKPSSYSQSILGGALTGVICLFLDMQWNTTMTHHSFLPLFFVVLGFAFSTEISSSSYN